MPGGDKTGSYACVTFVPMKPKVISLCKVYFVFKILFNKNSFCLMFNAVVRFDTWYSNKSLIYIAVSGSQNILFPSRPVNGVNCNTL